MIRFADEWNERNPNLYLIGAYLHADEPNGTVHLHCDYIPVAECSRGMTLQNSYDRALQQQGFKSENVHQTAQIAWQDSEREALCAICRELNIDVQRNQGIGKGREYLTPQEYKRAKDKMAEQIGTELQPLKDELEEYRMLKISEKAPELDEKRVLFQQRVSVPIDELETLKKQAKAYRTNRKEIKALRDKKIEFDKQQRQLNERSKSFDKQKEQLERDKQILESDYQNVMEMYDKQRNINECWNVQKTTY